jgi:hypothetical protein
MRALQIPISSECVTCPERTNRRPRRGVKVLAAGMVIAGLSPSLALGATKSSNATVKPALKVSTKAVVSTKKSAPKPKSVNMMKTVLAQPTIRNGGSELSKIALLPADNSLALDDKISSYRDYNLSPTSLNADAANILTTNKNKIGFVLFKTPACKAGIIDGVDLDFVYYAAEEVASTDYRTNVTAGPEDGSIVLLMSDSSVIGGGNRNTNSPLFISNEAAQLMAVDSRLFLTGVDFDNPSNTFSVEIAGVDLTQYSVDACKKVLRSGKASREVEYGNGIFIAEDAYSVINSQTVRSQLNLMPVLDPEVRLANVKKSGATIRVNVK